ncbi:hypothetical protein SPRG_21554 [Saprolegnia parasitica CBS 223.65]|uniref:EGF-like domain-containing protein n=1 Tax=Saprolegnia parasitica (strain CBS 223.65) TaxID=695850 RepID=A0A067BNZ2_SAPPC|nr:hypothetical protein SPRG_21554 [Saprolegnia parasitica CBS 223.65]KDO18480.1 hypothetical protein SPRG_21554 [Saprolegnia parasitica CBS 223.65]|eukprot:XP_012210813.1 hypothetical protein SPRG_21554 [Saprolegnia parasitica CBS 223.65]
MVVLRVLLAAAVTLQMARASQCPNDCSGHGLCHFQGVCQCSQSFMGADCSLLKCPMGTAWADYPQSSENAHNLAECANRGVCNRATGLCDCSPGFTGAACDRMACKCNGRGTCLSMSQLATTKDPGLGTVHPYTTPWDANQIYGCQCDDPFTGYSCTEMHCPRGDDPLTGTTQDPNGVQFNEKQVVTCMATGGSFTLAFRGFTTAPIPVSDSAASMQAKLLALPSLHGVVVTFSGLTPTACTVLGHAITIEFTQDFGNLPSLVGNGGALTLTTVGTSPRLTIVTTVHGTKEDAYCSNRGLCDRSTGVCNCFPNYVSSDGYGNVGRRGDCGAVALAITQCPGKTLACSGHGVCQGPPTFACICASGFQGGDCSEQQCPMGTSWFDIPSSPNGAHQLAECSNAGTCDRTRGVCLCDTRFTGAACNRLECPNDCSGHGTCLTMQNLAPLTKLNGDPRTAFTYGSIPNNNPNGVAQVNAVQTIVCTATTGTFTLGFRGDFTAPLPFTITSATLASILNLLPAFGQVLVSYSAGAAACTSNGANVISISFLSVFGALPPVRYTTNGVTSIAVYSDGTMGSVVGTKEDALCSNR